MNIRRLFDQWLNLVDNTQPKNTGILGVMGNNIQDIGEAVSGLLNAANTLKNSFELDNGLSFILNGIDGNYGSVNYQTSVNIWQLNSKNEKLYGYQLQNAFPMSVGTVELDDGEENTLSEFSVDFAYSEFIPLENKTDFEQITDRVLGVTGREISEGIDSLF
jgi:hypothetical protein